VRSSISEKKAIGRSGKSSSFIRTARGGTFQGTCDYARAETPALAGFHPHELSATSRKDLQIQLEDPYGMGTLMTWIVVQVVAPAACCQTVRVPL
jgi:hypothetical protein